MRVRPFVLAVNSKDRNRRLLQDGDLESVINFFYFGIINQRLTRDEGYNILMYISIRKAGCFRHVRLCMISNNKLNGCCEKVSVYAATKSSGA